MKLEQALKRLKAKAKKKDLKFMQKYGINTENALGTSLYAMRNIAKQAGKDHELAQELWNAGVREARILACLVEETDKVTERQLEEWVKEFNSWDLCDLCCSDLFDKTPFAYKKALEWSKRDEEFVKRAGFALVAALSVHDKKAGDEKFEQFFPIIKREACDERNFVKKAVNWALRNIGKRNKALNKKAIKAAEEIRKLNSKSARWIAADALRELKSEKVQKRLKKK